MRLNPNDITPLYKQLEDDLSQRIRTGEFQPGDRIPSEGDLAKKYGVSIITARKAVENLSKNGLVEKKQGKGTFVSVPIFRRNFSQVLSFSEACRMNNTTPGAKLLALEIMDDMQHITKRLERHDESKVVYVSRLRYVDNKPISIETNYFPITFAYLLEEKMDNTSLFEIIKKKSGLQIVHSSREFQICRATQKEAELLRIRKGMPLLLVDSIAYSSDYKPIFVGKQVINTEDYRFTI